MMMKYEGAEETYDFSLMATIWLLSLFFLPIVAFALALVPPFMYISYYGFHVNMFPVLFGANVSLNIVLSFINTLLLKKHNPDALLRVGMAFQLIAGLVLGFSTLLMAKPLFVKCSPICST